MARRKQTQAQRAAAERRRRIAAQERILNEAFSPQDRLVLEGIEIGRGLKPLTGRVPVDQHKRFEFTFSQFEYQGIVTVREEDGTTQEHWTTWEGFDQRPTHHDLAVAFVREVARIIAGSAEGSQQITGKIVKVDLGKAVRS